MNIIDIAAWSITTIVLWEIFKLLIRVFNVRKPKDCSKYDKNMAGGNGRKKMVIEFSPEIENCLRGELRQYAIAGRLKFLMVEKT
jgi:hypothetical protein